MERQAWAAGRDSRWRDPVRLPCWALSRTGPRRRFALLERESWSSAGETAAFPSRLRGGVARALPFPSLVLPWKPTTLSHGRHLCAWYAYLLPLASVCRMRGPLHMITQLCTSKRPFPRGFLCLLVGVDTIEADRLCLGDASARYHIGGGVRAPFARTFPRRSAVARCARRASPIPRGRRKASLWRSSLNPSIWASCCRHKLRRARTGEWIMGGGPRGLCSECCRIRVLARGHSCPACLAR